MTSINDYKYLFIIFIFFILFSSCNNREKVSTTNEHPVVNNRSSTSTSANQHLTSSNSNVSESPLYNLLRFNGKYEYEEQLFNKEPLGSRLKNAMGSRFQFFLDCCLVESPIKVENGIVYFEGCKAHDCPDVAYRVYIDVGANKIYIGLYNHGETTFFSEGDINYPKWLMDWWIINDRQKINYIDNKSSSHQNNGTDNQNEEEETVVRETLDGKYVLKTFEINSLADPNVEYETSIPDADYFAISFGKFKQPIPIIINIKIVFDNVTQIIPRNLYMAFGFHPIVNHTELISFNSDRSLSISDKNMGSFSLGEYDINIKLEPPFTLLSGKLSISINDKGVFSESIKFNEDILKFNDWGLIIIKGKSTPQIKSFYLKTSKEVFIRNNKGNIQLDDDK